MHTNIFRDLSKLAEESNQNGYQANFDNETVRKLNGSLSNQPKIDIRNTYTAFFYFAAINYLNAATKHNKAIGYRFKSCLPRIVTECYKKRIPDVRFYLTKDGKGEVLYCLFGESFTFSFHSPSINEPTLKTALERAKPIRFDGIRKQLCADRILQKAADLLKGPTQKAQTAVSKPSARDQSTSYSNRNGKASSAPTNFEIYSIGKVIDDFHLNRLISNPQTRENVAVVISTLYFYADLIRETNLPHHIRKEFFREMVTQSFSVVEAVEIDIGRLIARRNGKDLPSDHGKDPKEDQQICVNLCHKEFPMEPSTSRLYTEYKQLRHNVHLCKEQQIINSSYYTEETTEDWFEFMHQYLNYLASNI